MVTKIMQSKNKLLYIIYLLQIIALIPIVRFWYYVLFDRFTSDFSYMVSIRVFISFPILFICGILLIWKFHRIVIGFISILISLVWFMIIIRDLGSL